MSTATHVRAVDLITEIARSTDQVRAIVASGGLGELEAVLQSRGECIERLCHTMSELTPAEFDEKLTSLLFDVRQADRKLTEWMLGQKEEVAMALASLHQQNCDPYAEDTFVGPVLLNQTT